MLYDYECGNCGLFEDIVAEYEQKELQCPKCGGVMQRIFSPTNFHPFHSYQETNLGEEPVEINSFSHLERECRKRGLSYEVGPTKFSHRERPMDKLKKKVKNAIT